MCDKVIMSCKCWYWILMAHSLPLSADAVLCIRIYLIIIETSSTHFETLFYLSLVVHPFICLCIVGLICTCPLILGSFLSGVCWVSWVLGGAGAKYKYKLLINCIHLNLKIFLKICFSKYLSWCFISFVL